MTERLVDFGPDEGEVSDDLLNSPKMTDVLGLDKANTDFAAGRSRPLSDLLTDEDFVVMAENNDPNSELNRLEDEEVSRQLSAADAYPTTESVGEGFISSHQVQTHTPEVESE